MKTSKTTITLALTTVLGAGGAAFANENPFAMQVLDHGYQVAEAGSKAPEAKCAANKAEEAKCAASNNAAKAADGKCAASKAAVKAKDGKCGEGKCGANKQKPMENHPE